MLVVKDEFAPLAPQPSGPAASFIQVTDPQKGEIRTLVIQQEVDADGSLKHSSVRYVVEPLNRDGGEANAESAS